MKQLFFLLFIFLITPLHAQHEAYLYSRASSFKTATASVQIQEISQHKNIQKSTGRLYKIKSSNALELKKQVEIFKKSTSTIWVEEEVNDYQVFGELLSTTPNDPDKSSLQEWLNDVKASAAWSIGLGSKDIVLAVIDTGFEITHEDLADNIWINEGEIPNNGLDDDNNGFIDDVNGWNFFGLNANVGTGNASNNHGTHVAGLAAAVTNNNLGISSLSYNVSLLPIRIADDNGKNLRRVAEAIIYAVDQGADVINCSWGSTSYSKAVELAIEYAWTNDAVIVAAAGNSGNSAIYYPAGYPQSIAVASVISSTTLKSSFSNFGGFVDVAAPGGETNGGIYSTLNNNSYGLSFGTSMASPIVASLAALQRSIWSDWDAKTTRTQLETGAISIDNQNPDQRYKLGNGFIQADLAVVDPLRPLAIMTSYNFGDEQTVSPVFNRNEQFDIYLEFENLGINQSTIQISVQSLSNFLTISAGENQTFSASHGGVFSTNAFSIQVSPDASVNSKAELLFEITYDDGTTSNELIEVKLVPDNFVHTANTIELGLNGAGRIGFYNYPNTSSGNGFTIKNNSTTQISLFNRPLLREGGLMMGTGTNRISSSVRGSGNSVDNEFFLIDFFESFFDDETGLERGEAIFTDLNAGIDGVRFDIRTTLESFVQTSIDDNQYVLLKYKFENKHPSSTYTNFRAAWFFDYDTDFNNPNEDITFYDAENDWIAHFDGSEETDTTLYVGATILEGIHSPWIIDNNSTNSFYFGTSTAGNGFTDDEKWLAMNERTAALVSSRQRIGPANTSFVLSTQSQNLAPDESFEATVVLAYGVGYDNFQEVINRAKSQAPIITSNSAKEHEHIKPEHFQILSTYPNPFNPETTLRFSLNKTQNVQLVVTDILGRIVFKSSTKMYVKGINEIRLNGMNWSSGVYFVRLQTDNQSISSKITLLK